MATKNRRPAKSKSNVMDGFRISNGPVMKSTEEAGTSAADFGDVAELPRPHGAPELFAIARDPRTIFTYWSVDWPRLFAQTIPVDRQVHLRIPPDDIAQHADVDLVTIPFHLSFQRLIDLFGATNGAALAETISRFQKRALTEEGRELLTSEEREILRTMDLSLLEIAASRWAFIDQADDETLRKRTAGILSLSSTSPASGFSESSWSSAAP